jgi:hypothetical protein
MIELLPSPAAQVPPIKRTEPAAPAPRPRDRIDRLFQRSRP